MKSKSMALLIVTGLALSAGGCREEGTAERAGREIDEAADEIGDELEDAADEVEEEAEEARRKAKDALD
jgi:hypothetical protein